MVRPLQFLLNGVDITDRVAEAVIERQEKRGADKCEFKVLYTVDVDVGYDLKVKDVAGNRFVFGGRVIETSKEYGITRCAALSYGKEFDDVRVFPTKIYRDRSPEFIVSDLVSSLLSGWTVISASSGVLIGQYEASGTLSENLQLLATIAGFDFWTEVDLSGQKILHFRPANLNLGKTYYLGQVGPNMPNAVLLSYDVDDSTIYNAVEVYGGPKYETVEYRWDTISGVGALFFVRPASSVGVYINDDLAKEGTDYLYFPDYRHIVFTPNIYADENNPVKLVLKSTFYNSPIVYKENASSISSYGKRQATIIVEKILRELDLDLFAQKFVQVYGGPRTTLKVRIPKLDFDVRDGGFITIYDPYLGINGQNFVVRVVRWLWPSGTTEVYLAQFEPELYDYQRRINYKVEASAKSFLFTQDFGLVEKKFYLSGRGISAAPYKLEERWGNSVSHSSTYFTDTSYDHIYRLRLLITDSANNVLAEYYSDSLVLASASGYRRVFYSSPIQISEANIPSTIKVRAQILARIKGSIISWDVVAPAALDSTKFFETTVTGFSKIVNSSAGYVLDIHIRPDISSHVIYWGYPSQSNIFGLGFKK